MYVCLCRGITDSQLRAVVAEGNTEYRDLKQEFGVGAQCGKCIPIALAILAEENAKAHLYYEVA